MDDDFDKSAQQERDYYSGIYESETRAEWDEQELQGD